MTFAQCDALAAVGRKGWDVLVWMNLTETNQHSSWPAKRSGCAKWHKLPRGCINGGAMGQTNKLKHTTKNMTWNAKQWRQTPNIWNALASAEHLGLASSIGRSPSSASWTLGWHVPFIRAASDVRTLSVKVIQRPFFYISFLLKTVNNTPMLRDLLHYMTLYAIVQTVTWHYIA